MLDTALPANAAEIPHSFASTPTAFDRRAPSIAHQMAERVIVPLSKQGQPTAFGDLTNAGFTAAQIGAHFPKAKEIADAIVIRQDSIEPEPTFTREDRLRQARKVLDRLQPFAEDLLDDLRARRFSDVEIADLWPDLMKTAATRLGAMEAVAA